MRGARLLRLLALLLTPRVKRATRKTRALLAATPTILNLLYPVTGTFRRILLLHYQILLAIKTRFPFSLSRVQQSQRQRWLRVLQRRDHLDNCG